MELPRQRRTSATTGGIAGTSTSRPIVRDSQAIGIRTSKPTVGASLPRGHEKQFSVAALRECELLRPPKPRERCPLTNLSRTGFIEAAEDAGALIRLRKKGAVRGTLLADREKLLAYLRSFQGGPGHE